MKTLTLKRVVSLNPGGTFGVILRDFRPWLVTIERPWLDNKPFKSCIPAGTYECMRVTTPKHGDCFEVVGVPGRTAILWHVANFATDVQGCIGPGTHFSPSKDKPAVLSSRAAMAEFNDYLRKDSGFMLEISNCFDMRIDTDSHEMEASVT